MKISKDDKLDFDLTKDFNMKFIEYDLTFNVYKVIYTYRTVRGNNRENHRYLISQDKEEAKLKFIEYINKTNNEKPYRAISNVKILDVVLLGTVTK